MGLFAPAPNYFFVFLPAELGRRGHKKVIKKGQGFVRFARKTTLDG
jgi:hypothetical protein